MTAGGGVTVISRPTGPQGLGFGDIRSDTGDEWHAGFVQHETAGC